MSEPFIIRDSFLLGAAAMTVLIFTPCEQTVDTKYEHNNQIIGDSIIFQSCRKDIEQNLTFILENKKSSYRGPSLAC